MALDSQAEGFNSYLQQSSFSIRSTVGLKSRKGIKHLKIRRRIPDIFSSLKSFKVVLFWEWTKKSMKFWVTFYPHASDIKPAYQRIRWTKIHYQQLLFTQTNDTKWPLKYMNNGQTKLAHLLSTYSITIYQPNRPFKLALWLKQINVFIRL